MTTTSSEDEPADPAPFTHYRGSTEGFDDDRQPARRGRPARSLMIPPPLSRALPTPRAPAAMSNLKGAHREPKKTAGITGTRDGRARQLQGQAAAAAA